MRTLEAGLHLGAGDGMDGEFIRSLLGPLLTAVVAGLALAVKEAFEGLSAKQRARSHLQEASSAIVFIRDWTAVQASMGPAADQEYIHRAQQDLRRLYDQVFADLYAARNAADRPNALNLGRLFNSYVRLRITVPTSGATPRPGATKASPRPEYRRPEGAARWIRPLYWVTLAWGVGYAAATFQLIPDMRDEMNLVGAIATALIVALVGSVLPAAAVRALVLFLDERETEKPDVASVEAQTAVPLVADLPAQGVPASVPTPAASTVTMTGQPDH